MFVSWQVLILQCEGQKRWKLYEPPITLPMEYSHDLKREEIGRPVSEMTLNPGDLLYMPRGTVHEAVAANVACTHVTLSTFQQHTWGHYLLSVLPRLFRESMLKDVELRRGLPLKLNNLQSAVCLPVSLILNKSV